MLMTYPKEEKSPELGTRFQEFLKRPENAVVADDLLALTREVLHADLLFPLTEQDRGLFDYSVLELPFPASESLRLPKRCPVDVSDYLALSAEFASAYPGRTCLPWTYDWFYLEILCAENKLRPRLWVTWEAIEIGMPLIESSADIARHRGPKAEELNQQAKLWWGERLDLLLENRVVIEESDKPWLGHLTLQELPDDWEDDFAPLVTTRFPVYLWPQDGVTLAREMRYELFETSIFSPSSAGELRSTAVQELRNRFAIALRKRRWGEASGGRAALRAMDARILRDFESGMSNYRIQASYRLKERAVYHALARARRAEQESVTKTDSK